MIAYDILKNRGVTRLCHFTKLQSFTHIISSSEGILASNSIRQDIKHVTDKERYDGELDYVCCTVEYPNSWFLKSAIKNSTDNIFKEWIVLYIDLNILKEREAKFCPCNASKANGKNIESDMEKVEDIFNSKVLTFDYGRTSNMLPCCPTDGQAEILIKNNIPSKYVIGIAVGNEDIADRVNSIFITLNMEQRPIYIAPEVLTSEWSSIIKKGRRPNEIKFDWKGA